MENISLQYPFQATDVDVHDRSKVLAIGHFDGVHRGHQDVIRTAVDAARAEGLLAAVMTFHPHPKEVLGQGGQYMTCLTPLEDKVERFRSLGVDIVYVVRFDLTFAAVSPADFVENVLRPLRVSRVAVGFDFTFGAKGAGKAETLLRLCEPDLSVDIVKPLLMDGEKVSSTRIRECLADGHPEMAESMMGEFYSIKGTVVRGDGRGRTIGYPTANVQPEAPYVIPRQGVYAILAEVGSERFPGVLNIGVKPTFHDHLPEPVLEAHLFDFEGDLYDKTVAIRFVAFLRPEKKFGSIDELVGQIQKDAAEARSVLRVIK